MMALKPLRVSGQHPDQKKGATGDDVKVHGAIWPSAYSGNAQGGKAIQRHEDLRGPSLDDSHRAGYSSNDGRTQQQAQAGVKHSAKIGPKQAPKPAAAAHKGPHPKASVRRSGRTAPSAHAGEGHHRG